MIKYLISKMKGTHYVNFSSPNHSAIAFSVDSHEVREVKYKLSYVLCFKFCGVYIPVQQTYKQAIKGSK